MDSWRQRFDRGGVGTAAFPWIEHGSLGQSLVGGRFFAHLGEEHEPGIRA
jgi:hypothetical protein